MEHDPIAAAYEWGLRGAGRPRDDATERQRLEELMRMSPEERRAAMRGIRDGAPAVAPLPLASTLVFHGIWLALVSAVQRRGGHWRYLPAAAFLAGLTALRLKAIERYGKARARAAGIERRGQGPRVPQARTSLWMGLAMPVLIVRRLLGHPPRKQTIYEMGTVSLARELVEWWAWRPYLSRSRPRAAPPA